MRRAEQPRRVNQDSWVSDHSLEDSKTCCICIYKFPWGFYRVRPGLWCLVLSALFIGWVEVDKDGTQAMQEAKRHGIIDIPGPVVHTCL